MNSHPPSELTDLLGEYDKRWCNLDFVGVSDLWVRDGPEPIYIGDEYPAPLVGVDELERHWARLASRLNSASVSSKLHAYDIARDETTREAIARAVLLSRWRLTGRESDLERTGSSWITWLLVRRSGEYRIFHHMESQVYLAD
ncbi:MAG: hypothetical protein JO280_03755 [Mycobacteriaceae bacterium]|nr:hypothetical protein [Mycobacteriaceae bacterium]